MKRIIKSVVFITGVSILAFLLISCSSLFGVKTVADYDAYGDFSYGINDNGLYIIRYNGTDNSVVIPSEINGMMVKTIAGRSFASKNLISVTIPEGVTFIGYRAFANNQLASITIPNSVTRIDMEAFQMNRLTNIIIPENVTTINERAFQRNNLTSVVLSRSLVEIGEQAFLENPLTSVTFQSSLAKGFIKYSAFPGDLVYKYLDENNSAPGRYISNYNTASGGRILWTKQ